MLCVDNWEKIAENLDSSDLINLAYVCVDARTAARMVYEKKYKSKSVVCAVKKERPECAYCFCKEKQEPECSQCFCHQGIVIAPSHHVYGSHSNWIKNFEKSLRCLRMFGDLIPEVIIEPGETMNDRQLQKIIEYTNEFGIESRNTIILRKYLPFLMKNPLKNAYKAVMHTDEYSVDEFNTLFPDLQSLHINSVNSAIYMKQRLPNVKELFFGANECNRNLDIKNEDILLAMQLNPQIQKLVIDAAILFKLEMNDRKIKLISNNEGMEKLFQIIRPENYEEMYVDSRWIEYSPVGFIEKFINLKFLTMVYYQENLEMLCNKIAKLHVLRVIYKWTHDHACHYREIGVFFASTAIYSKLSTFSIHFDVEKNREQFYIKTIRLVDTALWQITLNEDGPKRFKFSIVLNKIQDM